MDIELTNAEAKLISDAFNADRSDTSLHQQKIPSALQRQADNVLASRGLTRCKATAVTVECYEGGNQYRIEYATLINTVLNDEREKAVSEMLRTPHSPLPKETAYALYDAGYRKQVQ